MGRCRCELSFSPLCLTSFRMFWMDGERFSRSRNTCPSRPDWRTWRIMEPRFGPFKRQHVYGYLEEIDLIVPQTCVLTPLALLLAICLRCHSTADLHLHQAPCMCVCRLACVFMRDCVNVYAYELCVCVYLCL